MSEQTPDSTTPAVNVDADQAVVNTAPDGGGVDNNEAAPEAPAADESTSESTDSE